MADELAAHEVWREHWKAILQLKIKMKIATHKVVHLEKESYCFVPKGTHTAFNTNYVTNSGQNIDNLMINKKTTILLKY